MTEKSQVARPGPVSTSLPTLPKVPVGGTMNAFGLNHWVVPPNITGPVKPGFHEGRTGLRVARWLEGMEPNCGGKGNRAWSVAVQFTVQPPTKPFSNTFIPFNRCLPFPLGRS